ncbi:MAG: polysaccharide biosynthesis tyrosine autokinase [Anaerolineae bacterium]
MEIQRYMSLIWRWAWLIVLGAIVAGGTAYMVSKNTTPIYRASSRLLIDEAPGTSTGNEYSQVLLEQRLAQTYVEIMQTEPVLQETIERLNLPLTTGQLAGMISISAPQDTQIIVLSVEDVNPDRAATIANTLGEVFIDQNRARDQLRYAEPISNWQQRLNEIGDEVESLETEINAFGPTDTAEQQAALSRLETQLNEAKIRYTEAFNNLNALQVAQAKESSNVIQIEPAIPSTRPIRPRTLTNTMLAAVVGGMLALGVVFLIEYLDDTIKTPDQVAEDTGLSALGVIAFIKDSDQDGKLITHRMPRDPISEAYRVLRTNLSFSAVDGGLRDLLITSSSPSEGKSTTAANLAVVMAQTGRRVILVDSDLRRPTQHRFFEVSNNQGLTTAILDSQTPIKYHLQETIVPFLRVLTSGPIPPNPAELLNSQRMSQVLEALREEAEMIVFDTPPTLSVADASILAPQVGGVLLVVDVGATRHGALIQAVERLRNANARVFGVVMNRLKSSHSRYYNYYYHYYSAYGHTDKARRRMKSKQNRLPGWLTGSSKR